MTEFVSIDSLPPHWGSDRGRKMLDHKLRHQFGNGSTRALACLVAMLAFIAAPLAHAADANVVVTTATTAGGTNTFTGGLRWTLEEDVTWNIDPANLPANPLDTASLQLHKSYMPVVATGKESGNSFTITGLDPAKRYFLSVLPDRPAGSACNTAQSGCYTMTGAPVKFPANASTTSARVVLTPQPIPPAQARVFVFDDRGVINGTPDANEAGLGGFSIFIYDAGGGQMSTDAFGNPIGTVYDVGAGLDGDAAPTILRKGDGTIHSMTQAEVNDPVRNPYKLKVGEALIQNISPGKYGIQVVPPALPNGQGWQQTTTIEGTPGIDVWLRAGEPLFLIEFGPVGAHAFYGFAKQFNGIPAVGQGETAGSISGVVRTLRMARPPDLTTAFGPPVPECWVGLNEMASGTGVYAAPCNEDSSFTISGVRPGTYQIVAWDRRLDHIISFYTAIVGNGQALNLGDVGMPGWFGHHEHYVFNDTNGDGIRQDGEPGIPDQTINLRFRDGSIYSTSTTDTEGYLPFDEVFPYFSWLIAEVDFARFKATGVTTTVDEGFAISGNYDDPLDPAGGRRSPQIQSEDCTTASCLQRTETGPALLEGYNSFAGTSHKFEWGKQAYGAGENGGITGVVYNQVTRAENDPRFATPEGWEAGIPRVQVNLYKASASGVIQDTNGTEGIQLADIDNYPLGFEQSGIAGAEDQDRDGLPGFGLGDAVAVTHTDSWDDNVPAGCVGDTLIGDGRCYDGIRNWSQIRPAVFDGGYAFGAPFTTTPLASGPYVVEANTPRGYLHQDEQSKNVDFGDTIAPQALPPACVGDPVHTSGLQPYNVIGKGDELSLFPGVEVDAGVTGNRPYCNFKLVLVNDGKNAASDFFMYTPVPVSGRIQGNTTNDIGNVTNPNSPNFGEKISPAHIPISIRDYANNEVNRLYTDANGRYNGLVPSTYRINAPMPTGVSPNMLQVCLNAPFKPDPANIGQNIPDPYYNPQYTHACYTLNFSPGTTTYLDTPVLPVAAFVGVDTWQLDGNYPNGTPVVKQASVAANGKSGGPYIQPGATIASGGRTLVLTAAGDVQVPDPTKARPNLTVRDYSFGSPGATKPRVFIGGVEVPAGSITHNNRLTITVIVPATFTTTGQVDVIRADNSMRSVHAITLTIGTPLASVSTVAAGQSIQAAIDAAPAGGLVLVQPGLYNESLILTKPLQLQGWGATATQIVAARNVNADYFVLWQKEAHKRANCPSQVAVSQRIGLLPGQPNNVGRGTDPCGWVPGTGLLQTEEAAGVLVAPMPNVFGAVPARIDGFTFASADFSAGVLVNGYVKNLSISNNIVTNNSGQSAAGIRIGHPALGQVITGANANLGVINAQNTGIDIHHNLVSQNGGQLEPGAGIGLYNGSDNYRVANNYIVGNFAQGHGAGIAHYGRSPGGVIENNQVLFNQSFDQTVTGSGGTGGGVLIAGYDPAALGAAVAMSPGSGSVKINGNRIQGNFAGTGDGGGIALLHTNGQDLLASPLAANWDRIDIINNMIVNNVAALAGGGISLQDAPNTFIIHNTIVNNDSSATAALAFGANPNLSDPQPAGIVSREHSVVLQDLPGLTGALIGDFSSPTLQNNIILGNRSMQWSSGVGVTVVGAHDLGVVPATAGSLTRSYNVLTQGGVGNTAANNNLLVAVADENSLLVTPYFNGDTGGLPPAAGFNAPLLAGFAPDEGGNAISVVYGPLTLVGDYHLESTGALPLAAAIDRGDNTALPKVLGLISDFDGQSRPVDGNPAPAVTIVADIGADEVAANVSAVAAPPVFVTTPAFALAYIGVPSLYQAIAVDPNGTPVSYSVSCVRNLFTNCNSMVTISSSGLMTFTPTVQGVLYSITITAQSSPPNTAANRSTQVISLTVLLPNSVPTAGNDQINVSSNGTFSVPAPGVLGNDSAGPLLGALSAVLVSNPAAGGAVTLDPSGAFSFLPEQGYVGPITFTYKASAFILGSGTPVSSGNATVTLNRELAATDMRFNAASGAGGTWELTGQGYVNGRTLTITRDRGGLLLGNATVAGNAWSASIATGNDDWQIGDTVSIVATGASQPAFTLAAVEVFPGDTVSNVVSSAFVQCPGDTNGNALKDNGEVWPANQSCRHLAAGDGYAVMGDGTELYTFGFNDVTGVDPHQAIDKGILNAQFPAPTLNFKEGEKAYVTLTNVGMLKRPDLFDPHSVHFHGFPNAGTVFDGVPESSIGINMGFSLTYYYRIQEPGTFMYHCHVEAPEHMQMGMLGNLFVDPAQNGTSIGGHDKFVYNDTDGSTGYDVFKAIQIGSFDGNFHTQHIGVQPLPFAEMRDDYPMLNGRGYPDTVNAANIAPGGEKTGSGVTSANESSQRLDSAVTAAVGQKILLRISNLSVTQFSTLATTGGLQMQVVGIGAHILRGPGATNGTGADLYYKTRSITLGGGEGADVLIDTTGVAPGRYLLYTTNLNNLSNGPQDFGGMMTEIVITP
jgi:large repetitive protein